MNKKFTLILLTAIILFIGCTSPSEESDEPIIKEPEPTGPEPTRLENEQSLPIEIEIKSLKTIGDKAIIELDVSRDVTTFNNSISIISGEYHDYDIITGESEVYKLIGCHIYLQPESKGETVLVKGTNLIEVPCKLIGLEKTEVEVGITFYPQGWQTFKKELEVQYDVWRNCTDFEEDLQITKLTDITPEKIFFEIKKNIDEEITIKGISGSPNIVASHNSFPMTLKTKQTTGLFLYGSFPECFDEEITIKYSVGKQEKTVKTVCSRTAIVSEEKVESLAEETKQEIEEHTKNSSEANILEGFQENFAKADECTAEKYVENWKEIQKILDGFYIKQEAYSEQEFNFGENEIALLKEQIEKSKDCSVNIEKEIFDKGNQDYSVKYSLLFEGNCNLYKETVSEKDKLILQIYLGTQYPRTELEVIKGENQIFYSYLGWERETKLKEIAELIGACTKQWFMGINPVKLLPSAQVFSGQKQCSQTPIEGAKYRDSLTGSLQIKNYDFTPNKLTLKLENISEENKIIIDNIRGQPVGLITVNPEDNVIEKSSEKTLELKGNFSGNIQEEITIFYEQNGVKKQHLSTCVGPT